MKQGLNQYDWKILKGLLVRANLLQRKRIKDRLESELKKQENKNG